MGFNLFTLIVKFNICDNTHPLSHSWNSSNDARIGSMCCSYHSHKSVYRYISLFFVIMFLLACLSFVANSLLNAVLLHYLSTASRTRSRTTLLASSKNRRGSMWLEFITAPVNIRLSNACRSLARQEIVRCYSRTHHSRTRHQYARNVAPIATLHSRVEHFTTADCLCPTARRGRLARQSSSSCSMHSSHRCSHAYTFHL